MQLALFDGRTGARDQNDAKNHGGMFMRFPTLTSGTLESNSRGGSDPMLPIGTARCQCSGCDRYFSSVGAFDKHRREGRCLSEAEMTERGMLVNARGYWVSEAYYGRGDE